MPRTIFTFVCEKHATPLDGFPEWQLLEDRDDGYSVFEPKLKNMSCTHITETVECDESDWHAIMVET